jgi:hypothetical protein
MTLVPSADIANAWAWAKKLVESGEFILVKLFRRRATFLAPSLWSTLAEIAPSDAEASWQAGELSTAAHHIAAFLLERGPTNTLELQQLLPRRVPILPTSLKRGLRELEEKLVIYPRRLGEHFGGREVNTWDLLQHGLKRQGIPPSTGDRAAGVARLVEGAVRAGGVVDARECGSWFPPWKSQSQEAMRSLMRLGRALPLSAERPWEVVWHGLRERSSHAAHGCNYLLPSCNKRRDCRA